MRRPIGAPIHAPDRGIERGGPEGWRRTWRDVLLDVGPRSGPCPWCLAPEVWSSGESRHLEVEADGVYWDAHWIPVSSDLYMHFAFDITERKHAEREQARLQEQLTQSQKMEAVGRLAGGVAHDFNNMLGVIIGHAELALMEVDPSDPIHHDLQEISRAAERSAALTRQLLAFARRQTVALKVVDLNEAVAGTLNMLRRLVGEDIDLAWLPGRDLWQVKIDPSQIDQILANLVVNARDAIPGVGRITIETANAVLDEAYCADHAEFMVGSYTVLAVSDNGVGMSKEVLERIFEPFFTTKTDGRGTGLGLATVYGIIKQNGGFINVYSELGQGSTFKIYFTRFETEAVEAPIEITAPASNQSPATVLIVEDETAILDLAKAILERQGYPVLAASSPSEAIALVRSYPDPIHLLVTDVVMPEMNGRDLAKGLRSLRPGLKCLYMSGYTANVIAHHGVLDEGVLFIQKPFSVHELSAKVREALESQVAQPS